MKEKTDFSSFPVVFTDHLLHWTTRPLELLRENMDPLLEEEADDSESYAIALEEREAEDEEDENPQMRPRREKTPRKALPTPPLRPPWLPLELHDILLGAPPELSPPSISVYTTGNSLSPALLPPANLPTANPPPGSRHIVSPTASSSPPTDGASAGISWRQTGHEFLIDSHGRMQSSW